MAKTQAAGVDAAGLFDAVIVAGKTEAGTQAESAQIQPAKLVRGAAFAAVGEFQHVIGELANRSDGP